MSNQGSGESNFPQSYLLPCFFTIRRENLDKVYVSLTIKYDTMRREKYSAGAVPLEETVLDSLPSSLFLSVSPYRFYFSGFFLFSFFLTAVTRSCRASQPQTSFPYSYLFFILLLPFTPPTRANTDFIMRRTSPIVWVYRSSTTPAAHDRRFIATCIQH